MHRLKLFVQKLYCFTVPTLSFTYLIEQIFQLITSFVVFSIVAPIINSNNFYVKVTIYSIRDPHNNDLDKALLGAIMKAMQDKPEASRDELESQLIFAVRWNRPDTAAKYIFDKNRQEQWPVSKEGEARRRGKRTMNYPCNLTLS